MSSYCSWHSRVLPIRLCGYEKNSEVKVRHVLNWSKTPAESRTYVNYPTARETTYLVLKLCDHTHAHTTVTYCGNLHIQAHGEGRFKRTDTQRNVKWCFHTLWTLKQINVSLPTPCHITAWTTKLELDFFDIRHTFVDGFFAEYRDHVPTYHMLTLDRF